MVLYYVLFATAIIIELAFCRLAYWTIGEVSSFLITLVCIFANIFPFIALFKKDFGVCLLSSAIIFVLIVPSQLYYGYVLFDVYRESHYMIAYINSHKYEEGSYPESLDSYKFHKQYLKRYFRKYRKSNDDFSFSYSIATENTSHSFTSSGYFYYPD